MSRLRRGFSLLEMMVAISIGLFVVAALYALFTQQQKQFLYQDLQMDMHQNGRLAMDVLTRAGRNAGAGTNGVTLGLFGWDGNNDSMMPAIISYNNTGANGSDAVTFVSMEPSLLMTTQSGFLPGCGTTILQFDPGRLVNRERVTQYHAGEMVMCYDFTSPSGGRSFLWPITGDGDATTGQIQVTNAFTSYGDFAVDCGGNLPASMSCSRAQVITFYIDADDTDGVGAGSPAHPVLMMDLDFESPDDDDVPLVEDIEDLQIEYCMAGADCTNGGVWINGIDTFTDASSANDADDVQMIRFTAVVRSPRQDPARMREGSRIDIADNTGVSGTTDLYFRQVLSAEVMVRNMRLLQVD